MTFRPGCEKHPRSGRKPGQRNKLTRIMREEWLAAYEAEGGVEYLRKVARDDPATFVRGLIRMIPNEIAGRLESENVVRIVDLSDRREEEPGDLEAVDAGAEPLALRGVARELPPVVAEVTPVAPPAAPLPLPPAAPMPPPTPARAPIMLVRFDEIQEFADD